MSCFSPSFHTQSLLFFFSVLLWQFFLFERCSLLPHFFLHREWNPVFEKRRKCREDIKLSSPLPLVCSVCGGAAVYIYCVVCIYMAFRWTQSKVTWWWVFVSKARKASHSVVVAKGKRYPPYIAFYVHRGKNTKSCLTYGTFLHGTLCHAINIHEQYNSACNRMLFDGSSFKVGHTWYKGPIVYAIISLLRSSFFFSGKSHAIWVIGQQPVSAHVICIIQFFFSLFFPLSFV